MPAAAVIPAPIAYILVVAAKKLVVGFRVGFSGPPMVSTAVAFLTVGDLLLGFIVRDRDSAWLL